MSFVLDMIAKVTQTLNFSIIPETSIEFNANIFSDLAINFSLPGTPEVQCPVSYKIGSANSVVKKKLYASKYANYFPPFVWGNTFCFICITTFAKIIVSPPFYGGDHKIPDDHADLIGGINKYRGRILPNMSPPPPAFNDMSLKRKNYQHIHGG